MSNASITVRTSFQGIHCWKDAPEQVAFLRYPHRHVFHVAVMCHVTHADRELEFFMVRQEVDSFLVDRFPPYHEKMPDLRQLGQSSCETVADDIRLYLLALYKRNFSVSVKEDDENSATVRS